MLTFHAATYDSQIALLSNPAFRMKPTFIYLVPNRIQALEKICKLSGFPILMCEPPVVFISFKPLRKKFSTKFKAKLGILRTKTLTE